MDKNLKIFISISVFPLITSTFKSFHRTTGLYHFLTILKKSRSQWKSDESYSHRLASQKRTFMNCGDFWFWPAQYPFPLLVNVGWFSFQGIISLVTCHCDLIQEYSQLSVHNDHLEIIFDPNWHILEILWKRSLLFLLNLQRRRSWVLSHWNYNAKRLHLCKATGRKAEAREKKCIKNLMISFEPMHHAWS